MNFVLTAHEFKLPGYSQASVQWWIEGRDIYTCNNRLCINYPWHHTAIYDCSIPSYKKDTKTAVIEQMDRTFNVESLYHLYSSSFTTLHTKINYSRITCVCNKQKCFKSSASAHHSVSSRTVMFFSVIMYWTSVVVLVYWASLNV